MARRRANREPLDGIFLIDKPYGRSSRTVVEDVVRRLGLPSAGHCGTLDPLATGLLVIVTGAGLRLQEVLTGHKKTYTARIRFGTESASDDAEGPFTHISDVMPDQDAVLQALRTFEGEIEQLPPQHAAIRVDGERAFQKARRGEQVAMPVRRVRIGELSLLACGEGEITVRVDVSAGTYIRSLARDIGRRLGCGAYLADLRRESIGAFQVAGAKGPDVIAREDALPIEAAAADLPRLDVDRAALDRLLHGLRIAVDPETARTLHDPWFAWHAGKLVARCIMRTATEARMDRLIRRPDDPSPIG